MTKSGKCDAHWRWAPLLGVALACPAAVAQVQLDKLTACDDVSSAFRMVASWHSVDHDCHGPQNALDALLIRKLGDSARLCFESWPQPMLRGLSCAFDANNPGAVLTCMRPIKLADLSAYKATNDHDRGAASVDYGTQAQHCQIYRGDVGPVQPTLIPPLLAPIARLEFGFIASIGEDKPKSGYVIHGFASVDPSLGDEPDALEFVSFLAGGTIPDFVGKRESVGRLWWLSVDPDEAFDAAADANFRTLPLASHWNSTTFDVQQRYGVKGGPSLDITIDALFDDIVAGLEMEGFEPINWLDKAPGWPGAFDPAHLMEQSIPYGLRSQMTVAKPPQVAAMSRIASNICPADEEGGYIAMVIARGPEAKPDRDTGTISLELAAFGTCPRLEQRARPYVEQLSKDAEIIVRDYLGSD